MKALAPGYPELTLNTVIASETPFLFYYMPKADAPAMVTTLLA